MAAKNSNIDQKSLRMSASGIEKPNFADRGRRQIRRNHADGDSIRNVHERSVSSGSTPNTNLAVATVAYLWWQNHKDKHKQIPADDLEILYSEELLGGGAYGEVFHAVVRDEERGEIRAVAKRARDGSIDPDDPAQTEPVVGGLAANEEEVDDISFEEHLELWEMHNQSFQFLQVEAYINDLVQRSCPEIAAPYLGICRKKGGVRWLVWEHVGEGLSLQSYFDQAAKDKSLCALASALRVEAFEDDDPPSLQRLANTVARQLLTCCAKLEQAGVAHRDLKPANLILRDGTLTLIDFGAAAAMGVEGQAGYDSHVAPCDLCYAPPEQFIDESEWAAYDVYSVGLILLRILFPPLWSTWHWHQFVDTFAAAGHNLDRWLENLIALDPVLQQRSPPSIWQRISRSVSDYFQLGSASGSDIDQRYVDLATESSKVGPEDAVAALTMGSLRRGLEVLHVGRGGVCWDSLRGMLARTPKGRLSSQEALARLAEEQVVEWDVWRERRDKLRAWRRAQQRAQQAQRTPLLPSPPLRPARAEPQRQSERGGEGGRRREGERQGQAVGGTRNAKP